MPSRMKGRKGGSVIDTGKLKKYFGQLSTFIVLTLGTFAALAPIISCIVTAFKSAEEYQRTNVMILPESWLYFENFKVAWEKARMGLGFQNSFIVLAGVLVGSIMFSSMLAFVLNRFAFNGNKLIRNLFLFASLIPPIATQVTVYKIMYTLGLVDKLYGYIILLIGSDIISIYIFLQFFSSLSVSLDESAIIDGSTYFGVFFKILFPLLKPAIVTVMILKGVTTYNEYYMANLYLQSKTKLQVVSTSLYTFTGPLGSQYNYICAGVIITMIPALIIFLSFQKKIYNGLSSGAIKG